METERKYDLLCISLLIFSAVVVSALAVDPKGFALSAWQPLIAAVLALGGALIVYKAAMAKVDLDRQIYSVQKSQKERGLFLRTAFAALIMHNDALAIFQGINRRGRENVLPEPFEPSEFNLRSTAAIEDAWLNLQAFPQDAADEIARLKIEMLNVENAFQRGIECGPSDIAEKRLALSDMSSAVERIAKISMKLNHTLTNLTM